ncbi:prostaglandin reductase 1-like isoform X2 [Biomphalaria glabrata]
MCSFPIDIKYTLKGKTLLVNFVGFVSSNMDSQKGTSQTWIKCRNFFGTPKRKDLKNVCQDLPDIQKGEILVEALCWTVDNYMTAFNVPEGSIMIGEQVASVIETLHEDYPLRMLVICDVGWRTRTIINPDKQLVRRLTDIGSLPASLYLGTLGLPGLCAYFTTCEVFQVKAGDVLVINAASSPISNVVGQIAKIKGCKVIAFAGSKERCDWVRELGFDCVFNANAVGISPALQRVASQGVDFYFDSVGASFTKEVLAHVNSLGTICVCGYISTYGNRECTDPYHLIFSRERQVSSTSVMDYTARFEEAEKQLLDWINMGKLKFRELLFNGFEKLPEALAAVYDMRTVGKVIVKSAAAPSLLTMLVEY